MLRSIRLLLSLRSAVRVLIIGIASILCGCGYAFVTSGKSFEVDVFDNMTERRGHEVLLTQRVVQGLKKKGFALKDGADYILRGRISRINQEILALSRFDEVIAGSLEFTVDYEVVGRTGGAPVYKGSVSSKSSFSDARQKTQNSAISEILQDIADSIAIEISGL